jgi:putative endonuclease
LASRKDRRVRRWFRKRPPSELRSLRLLAKTGGRLLRNFVARNDGEADMHYCVYIMTNKRNTVLYTGVTRDLTRRVWQHKNKLVKGFTKKYNIVKLVYYEVFDTPMSAIEREKRIKGGSRQKKIGLIESTNPEWRDLYDEVISL